MTLVSRHTFQWHSDNDVRVGASLVHAAREKFINLTLLLYGLSRALDSDTSLSFFVPKISVNSGVSCPRSVIRKAEKTPWLCRKSSGKYRYYHDYDLVWSDPGAYSCDGVFGCCCCCLLKRKKVEWSHQPPVTPLQISPLSLGYSISPIPFQARTSISPVKWQPNKTKRKSLSLSFGLKFFIE